MAKAGTETNPTKKSTMARLMTKNLLRRCKWRLFVNTIMVMRFKMTIARHSEMSITNSVVQSDVRMAERVLS